MLKSLKEENLEKIFWLLIVVTIIAGFFIRIKNLGKWPFAVDEYYFVKSVENIIKYGVPKFDAGGYYSRGILQQYLTAGLMLTGIKAEFAARIIPAITNILTLIPLYLIVKKVGSKWVIFFIIIVFSFSVWEIEFARFARMYTPFQMMFVWYCYFLIVLLTERNVKYYWYLYSLSFISIFIYEGSVFLQLLNFLPLFWFKRVDIKHLLIPIILLIINYILFSIDFRFLNTHNLYPANVDLTFILDTDNGSFAKPLILFSKYQISSLTVILGILFLIIQGKILYGIFYLKNENALAKLSFLIVSLIGIFNQFGLAVVIFVFFVILDWVNNISLKSKIVKLSIYSFLTSGIFWTIYCLFSKSWFSFFDHFSPHSTIDLIKRVFILYIDFPGLYSSFWVFYKTIPDSTFITFGLLSFLTIFIVFKKSGSKEHVRLLLLLILLCFSGVGFFVGGGITRYHFFYYPLVIISNIIAIYYLICIVNNKYWKLVTIILFALLFLKFNEDFDIHHIINVDKYEVNFRQNYGELLEKHYYRRDDIKTTTDFVNKNSKPNDIIIINEPNIEYYLKKLDYVYIDKSSGRLLILSTNNGKNERWTNKKLIYSTNDLFEKFKDVNHKVWFIVNKKEYLIPPLKKLNFFRKFKNNLVFESKDKMIAVYKFLPHTKKEDNQK